MVGNRAAAAEMMATFAEEHRVCEHHDRLHPRAGNFRESGIEIVRRAHLEGQNLDRQRRSGSFNISPPSEIRIAAIDENTDPGHAGDQLACKFHLLAGKAVDISQQAGDIAARLPVTGFQVASVHSMEDFSAMRFAFDANRITTGVIAGRTN
jgi:hypothetical protein